MFVLEAQDLSCFTVFFIYLRKQKGRKRRAESTELMFGDELLPVFELPGVLSTQVTIFMSFSSLQNGYLDILYHSNTSFLHDFFLHHSVSAAIFN